jgi:pimeloyl-ACP methyl ester carboxylesterase
VCSVVAVEPAMLCFAEFSAAGRAALADFRRDVIAPANAAFRQGDDALGAALMTGGIHSAQAPAASGALLQRRLRSALAMRMLALSHDEFPLLPPEQLAALPMPVLLLSGRQTPAIHAEVFRNVCAAMPQAAVARVDGAGHALTREQPAAFNRLALAFLQSVPH